MEPWPPKTIQSPGPRRLSRSSLSLLQSSGSVSTEFMSIGA